MTAGSGVTHTERSHPDDRNQSRGMFGLQTWVALPTDTEEATASFHHASASDIPTDTTGQSSVRVAVGSGWGLDSPVTGSSPLLLAEISFDPDSPVPLASELPELAVIALTGDVRVNDETVATVQLAARRTAGSRKYLVRGVRVRQCEPVVTQPHHS